MSALAGKIVLVTGARAGLGAAIAEAAASFGAKVIVAGRRIEDCAQTIATITAAGGTSTGLALDVSDLPALHDRAAAAISAFGRLDVLVNNAATIEPMGPIPGIDPIAFDQAMRVNVTGPAALTAALWPHLSHGRVINVVSGAALRPLPGWAAYCASKAALLMLTQSTALEGASQNLKAFAFAPGLVDTNMQAAIRTAKVNQVSDVPQADLLPPSVPANAVAWLAAGFGDEFSGTFVDIRQAGLLDRITTDLPVRN